MNELLIALVSIFGSVITATVTYIIWKKKQVKKQELEQAKIKFEEEQKIKELEKRNILLAELCNYIAGAVDILNEDTISVTPEIRKTFREFSDRYHDNDLAKIIHNKETK